jgi:hypothetical protein
LGLIRVNGQQALLGGSPQAAHSLNSLGRFGELFIRFQSTITNATPAVREIGLFFSPA